MAVITDPQAAQLRPLLHQEIDRLRDEDLAAARRVLLELEATLLARELGGDLAKDWASGTLTDEGINAAIHEHRQRHPYNQSE